MSQKTEFEMFITYGIEQKISTRDCIKNEILLLVFSLPSIIIERGKVISILFLLPALFSLISIIKLRQGDIIEGTPIFLYNGIMGGCFSFIFILIGVEILFYLFDEKERIVLMLLGIGGYILAIAIYGYIYYWLDKKKTYSNVKKAQGVIPVSLCAALGMIAGRVIFKDVDNNSALKIVCGLFFSLSYLVSGSVFNFYRFLYIMKHPEILDK